MAKNSAWDAYLNGSGNSAFQYSAPIQAPQSQFETYTAYQQRNQGQADNIAKKNWELRNQQTAFDNQQEMLKSLFSGSGGGGGDVGAPSDSNRFEPGLSDVEMRLKSLLDNPDSINQSAAYKFRVRQGEDALQRNLGARGMLNSGNRLMELQKYGQDMGSQEYDAQAGRLAGLLGNYSQGWLGDKNANTGIYSAQQTAKANNDRNRLGWAGLAWDMNKPQSVGGSRFSGGGETQGPLYGYGQSATSAWNDVLQNDLAQAKIQQVRGY